MRPAPSATKLASTSALEEAAEWFAQFDGDPGNASAESNIDRRAFERWLQEPEHLLAWQELQQTVTKLAKGKHSASLTTLERAEQYAQRERRKLLIGGSSALLVLFSCLLSFFWWNSGLSNPAYLLADQLTARGERQQLLLEDGSELLLNSASAVKIDFTENKRQIELLEGEVFISVASDPLRPLTIVTAVAEATALGTEYAVYWRPQNSTEARIAVYESKVRACAKNANIGCRELDAGQQLKVSQSELYLLPTAVIGLQPDWIQGRINIDDQPLIEVLQSLSLHYSGLLHFNAAELDGLRVSGSLPLDDIPKALDALSISTPISITQFGDKMLFVSRRD